MLVRVLEGLYEAEGLVDVAADGEVVDGDLAGVALVVDDEEAAEGDPLVLLEHPVGLADGVVGVGEDGDGHLPQAALRPRPLRPGPDPVLLLFD